MKKILMVVVSLFLASCASSDKVEGVKEVVRSCMDTCQEEGGVVDTSFVNVCACKPSKETGLIEALTKRVEVLEAELDITPPKEEVPSPNYLTPVKIETEDITLDDSKEDEATQEEIDKTINKLGLTQEQLEQSIEEDKKQIIEEQETPVELIEEPTFDE